MKVIVNDEVMIDAECREVRVEPVYDDEGKLLLYNKYTVVMTDWGVGRTLNVPPNPPSDQ